MRKFPMVGVLSLIPAFALVFLVGCPSPAPKSPTPPPTSPTAPVVDKGKAVAIKAPTDATIKGMVKFKGEIPKPADEPAIAKHKEAEACMAGKGFHVKKQEWLVSDKGGVGNVIVSLAAPAGMKFEIADELKKSFKDPVVIDQPFCAYVPHVVALYAEVQPLIVKNSAKISHNVRIEEAGDNIAFDSGIMASGGETKPRTFYKTDKTIGVKCSMHDWMTAKIQVFTHPYFAVSKADGSFEIKNVPIDTELIVYMWHETTPQKVEAKKMSFKKGDNPLELEISGK